ncbi:MAG: hypothetical protein M3406_02155 [Chloroflexota bacterium]|nr:hypothetical protein [Chloroflexota bacterium]
MTLEVPQVEVGLWRADAIVLFDCLMSTDLNTVPITHPSQKQALVDLLCQVDMDPEASGFTPEELQTAQADVAKDMGW